MIAEALFLSVVFPLYVILLVIWWQFRYVIKMMTDAENLLNDDKFLQILLIHQKRVLNIIGNEGKVLGSKKQWAYKRVDKASDETISKTC